MMKLILPDNIFSKIFLSEINNSEKLQTEFSPSALISKRISAEENSLGLVPTLDLLTFKELLVSRVIGMSFNALLSNSYIHFKEKQNTINEIFLCGDVSSNEAILSKILLREFYNINVNTTLLSRMPSDFSGNLLVVGDDNYEKKLFADGLSFAEEIIELISAPYVNFVLAGTDETLLKDFALNYKGKFIKGHSETFGELFPQLPKTSLDFLRLNIQHLIFDFEEQDIEGIKLLLQLPFFHGIINDMMDVKFV
jgi:hypothetical protein